MKIYSYASCCCTFRKEDFSFQKVFPARSLLFIRDILTRFISTALSNNNTMADKTLICYHAISRQINDVFDELELGVTIFLNKVSYF